MKILISLLLFFTTHIQAQAKGVDYNSESFNTCMRRVVHGHASTMSASDGTQICEYYAKNGTLDSMIETDFIACYDIASLSLKPHDALSTCNYYLERNNIAVFTSSNFKKCYSIVSESMKPHDTISSCIYYHENNKLRYFAESNLLTCINLRSSMRPHDAVSACLYDYKSTGVQVSQSLTLEQVNNNIQVPENTQIILKTAIEMPGKQSCVAAKDGARDVKCWVCRAKESRNDVLYRLEKDEATGLSQKILPVSEAKLSTDGKEIHFPLVHDSSDTDNLSLILCSSKKVFQIKSRAELLPILESNDLKLIIPAPKEK